MFTTNFVSEPDFFTKYEEAEEIVLREYQDESVEGLRANIRAGIKTQILASMVGSGKTVMAAFLIREAWRKGVPSCFVVDRLSLLGQTSDVFDRYGIPHGVVQSSHPRRKPGELVQICSIQTVKQRGWPQAKLVIADECHILHQAMKDRILNNDGAVIIGLSATPFTKGLGKFYGGIVNVTTGNKLTEEGFLVPFKVWAAHEPDMVTNAPKKAIVAGEWTTAFAEERAMKIIGDVVGEYQKRGEDRKTICFGVDVKHCEEMQRQFLRAGIRAELYTYLTGDGERDIMLKEFRKPDSSIRILISVAALSRGFDVPDVGCIIYCRPLKSSLAEFIQILGRGLRSHPSKKDCIILDLAGNFMRHHAALMEFMENGVNELDDGKPKEGSDKKAIVEKPPVKCPKCSYLPVKGSFCESCGYEFPKRSAVTHEAGELGEFRLAKAKKWTMEEKAQLFAELKYLAIAKRWKTYRDGAVFKAIVGVYPNSFKNVAPCPPSADTLALVDAEADKYRKSVASKAWRHTVSAKKPVFATPDLFA